MTEAKIAAAKKREELIAASQKNKKKVIAKTIVMFDVKVLNSINIKYIGL
jgi:hypothetical protein